MKKLLFMATFLVAAPLLIGQEDPFILYKERVLEHKVSEYLFFISADQEKRARLATTFEKMRSLNECMRGSLTEAAVSHCSEVKNQLLAMNDRYLPSEDKTLKRRLENPDEVDILDFTPQFRPDESITVNHMANVIDKNIERSNISNQLEQEDPLLKQKVLDEVSYRYFVNGWWSWLKHSSENEENFKKGLNVCSSSYYHDQTSLNTCSNIKEFIKDYIPKLSSQSERKIDQKMFDNLDANSAYSKARMSYQASLKDLYTQQ